jgi:hypothetical protein
MSDEPDEYRGYQLDAPQQHGMEWQVHAAATASVSRIPGEMSFGKGATKAQAYADIKRKIDQWWEGHPNPPPKP